MLAGKTVSFKDHISVAGIPQVFTSQVMEGFIPDADATVASRVLAAGGRFVIRYDHRDTGRSVSYPAGAPGYTGADLAADVVGVLDALGLRSAHLAGISMGGALAQQVA